QRRAPARSRAQERVMGLLDPAFWSERVFSVGGWVPGSGGAADVVEPATGDVLGRVGGATQDDVTKAAAPPAHAPRGGGGGGEEGWDGPGGGLHPAEGRGGDAGGEPGVLRGGGVAVVAVGVGAAECGA